MVDEDELHSLKSMFVHSDTNDYFNQLLQFNDSFSNK